MLCHILLHTHTGRYLTGATVSVHMHKHTYGHLHREGLLVDFIPWLWSLSVVIVLPYPGNLGRRDSEHLRHLLTVIRWRLFRLIVLCSADLANIFHFRL